MRNSKRSKKTIVEIANRKLLGELITERLFFIENPQHQHFKELWENCFNSKKELDFIQSAVSPDQLPPQEESDLASLTMDMGPKDKLWFLKTIDEGKIVGFAHHGNVIKEEPNSIGIVIGEKYSKHGLGEEVLNRVCEDVKKRGMMETYGYCYKDNFKSISLMEKCGFKKEQDYIKDGIEYCKYKRTL
jgi:RimJ/RimL family protein N-acetyltransferase